MNEEEKQNNTNEDYQGTSTPPGPNVKVEEHKLWAVLGYIIPVLFFVPLVSENTKDDAFARFHANQQLTLLIIWIIGWVFSVIFIGLLINLFALVLMIFGIINAANGEQKKLPLVGNITLLK